MRKWILGLVLVVPALAVVAAGATYAAYRAPGLRAEREAQLGPYGPMMRWGGGEWDPGLGHGMLEFIPGMTGLRDDILGALAGGLGLTQEDLSARLDEGESLVSIAEAQDLTDEELQALWTSAWEGAVRSAVDNGLLTEAQADWILQHIRAGGVRLGLGIMRGPMPGGWRHGMGRRFPVWP